MQGVVNDDDVAVNINDFMKNTSFALMSQLNPDMSDVDKMILDAAELSDACDG